MDHALPRPRTRRRRPPRRELWIALGWCATDTFFVLLDILFAAGWAPPGEDAAPPLARAGFILLGVFYALALTRLHLPDLRREYRRWLDGD